MKRCITLRDGRRWMVIADSEEIGEFTVYREHSFASGIDTHCQVVVPAEAIFDMSDEEIGQTVRQLTNDAKACLAEAHAHRVIAAKPELYRNWQKYLRYMPAVKLLLQDYQDCPIPAGPVMEASEIPYALTVIEKWEKHVERKQKGKLAGRYERAAAAKDYDALFIAIGRRDGFKCAACGSVEKLQLDHIEPVTLGGETKPENLQLLCPSCNSKKGEQTIDYRGTHQANELQ